jgi:hypothetical protein
MGERREMTTSIQTSIQRLDRMRKSFEKDKSMLAEDYKYFITPDAPSGASTVIRENALEFGKACWEGCVHV